MTTALPFVPFLLAAACASATAAASPDETLLLQQPAISRDHVVFVYAEDLWLVGREGGEARRLTSSPGTEQNPSISPDGKLVAFTGEYEGNADVYVISIDSGAPRRLTWHPGTDAVRDWHPDGKRVLFASARSSPSGRTAELFLVPLDGGMPEPLPIPRVSHAAFDASAGRIAYTPFPDAFRTWKRYRGGRTTRVWIFDVATNDVEEVEHVNASDTWPCWIGDVVYFASDRDGVMNVWRYVPGSGEPEQVTRFTDYDVRNMDADGESLVFEQAGRLHVLDPQRDGITTLSVRVKFDDPAGLPRWRKAEGAVRAASVAPNGKRALFEARGEIVSVPREHGDARNLTQSPGAHDRDPVWSPDGKQVAWLTDASGEYRLRVVDHLGREEPKDFDLSPGGQPTFYSNPRWSPDGKHVLFTEKTNRLAFLTLESGAVTAVSTNQGSLGEIRPQAVWSPDSRWIAFEERDPDTLYDHIALYGLDEGTLTRVTDGFGSASGPAFSADGKHLFFTATVESGPKRFGLDMSTSAARDFDANLYLAVLKKEGENPLGPRSDEGITDKKKDGKGKKGEDDDEDGKDDEKKDGDDSDEPDEDAKDEKDADAPAGEGEENGDATEEEEVAADDEAKEDEQPKEPSIDLDGLDQRILALPLGAGIYGNLAWSKKALLFIEWSRGGGQPELKSFDFDKREAKSVEKNVSSFEVSADRSTLLVRSGSRWKLMKADGGDEQTLDIDSVRLRVDPRAEWPQILREVWRIERDYFYDPNMHHVDWPQMWERWSPFLDHVKHRSDLNMVIGELIGELACGHEYVSGGEVPDPPEGVSTGLLGADFVQDSGRHRIERIYRGQNWNPGLRAPFTEPGVDAREGDYLIQVNGAPLAASDNLFAAFQNTAGRQVEIVLSASPDGAEPRTMTVVPLSSDSSLRNRQWVEDNRRRVDELSGGRLAYIYMPNTGGAGMAAFDRDYYSQIDKQGLVIDERYNGGGQVADYVIHTLSRKTLCYWMNREQWVGRSPFSAFDGPKVMIINETAGSGGDWMPWQFQQQGLGPLVGTRTWGGLVGISGYPVLMDGGSVTAASFGVMDLDGNWAIENEGVHPDHEVIEWPKPIIEGHDPQLEKAVELALDALESRPPRRVPTYAPPALR